MLSIDNTIIRAYDSRMTTDDLIAHFGSAQDARRHLGLSRQLWWIWSARGIPYGRQAELQLMSGGRLVAQTRPTNSNRKRVA